MGKELGQLFKIVHRGQLVSNQPFSQAFAEIGVALSKDYPLLGPYFVWLGIPFTMIVSWVFSTMQRIGIVGENPFEGSANDVPISTIARGIEIDLREILDETPEQIPEPYPVVEGVQM